MTKRITRRSTTRRRALAALAAATVFLGLSGAAPAVAAASKATTAHGEVLVAHGDNFAGGTTIAQTAPRAASASPGPAAATAHVSATGSTRSMRVAVVLLRLPGSASEPVSTAAVQSTMFGATKSVANWYSQTSGGQVAITGTVYGYFTGVSSCDLATELSAGASAAAKSGYVASNYDDLVVYTPDQGCDFSGMGWIGASGIFLNGNATQGVIDHEIGHNLGLLHAGLYACGAAALSPGCLIDYGDPTDVMGDPSLNRGFSAEHKYMLGWIPASEVRTVTTGTQTIALTASEHPVVNGSTELIHLRAADGALFAVDLRASVGYDAGLAGVRIRQIAHVKTDDTELLGTSALSPGQSFNSTAHKITVETLAVSGETASVRVCVGACTTSVSAQKVVTVGPIAARNIVTGAKSLPANTSIRLTVAAGHGVATGHTVIVSTYASNVGGAVSCADSRGDVYGVNVDSAGAQRLIVCSAHASTGLPPGSTITIRYPAFNGTTVSSANDFSGIRAVSRVDGSSVRGANTTAVDSGATARTRRTGEVVFGVSIRHGAASFTPTTGYKGVGAATYLSGNARITIDPEFKVAAAIGTFRLGGTLSSAQQWRAAVITFFRA